MGEPAATSPTFEELSQRIRALPERLTERGVCDVPLMVRCTTWAR
ncbi:hypothetical protein [Sorangium sp. So ce406]